VDSLCCGMQAVCKALDSLVADGKINSKTYNKQTVYVANQVVHIFIFNISLLCDVDVVMMSDSRQYLVALSSLTTLNKLFVLCGWEGNYR